MKIYISVPITGRDIEEVKADIEKAKSYIIRQGHTPVSPLDGVTDFSKPWIDYIIRDLGILKECDGLYQLQEWPHSFRCLIEYYAAKGMGMSEENWKEIKNK